MSVFRFQIMRGKSSASEVAIRRFPAVVGRHHDCRLRITSRSVSRHHCMFLLDGETLILRDLGSSNGTFLNGQAVSGQVPVQDGDIVEVGPVQLRVVYPKAADGTRDVEAAVAAVAEQVGEVRGIMATDADDEFLELIDDEDLPGSARKPSDSDTQVNRGRQAGG